MKQENFFSGLFVGVMACIVTITIAGYVLDKSEDTVDTQVVSNTGYQEQIWKLEGDVSILSGEVQFIQDYFTSSANDRRQENESQGRLIARTLYKQYGCTGDTMVVDYAWKVGGNPDKGLIHVVDTPFGSMLVDEAKIDINRLKEEPRCVEWKYLIDKNYMEYQQM